MALYSICITSIIFTLEIAMVAQVKSTSTAFRKPRRVTITIPYATYLELERRCYEQGRSLSNLSAYLLECAVSEPVSHQPLPIPGAGRALMTSLRGH